MASGLDGHVGGLHKPRPSASSCQTSAEHFQQCGEFLPVRNRGLRPLAVTVLPVPLTRRATYRLRRRAIDSALFRRWRGRRQAAPATSLATRAAQATRIMQQMRSGPKQLRALAEELDARPEAKCQRREIDLCHEQSAQPDRRQKSDRSGETGQRLSRPPFQPHDRF